jgi:hypothetical protein
MNDELITQNIFRIKLGKAERDIALPAPGM